MATLVVVVVVIDGCGGGGGVGGVIAASACAWFGVHKNLFLVLILARAMVAYVSFCRVSLIRSHLSN